MAREILESVGPHVQKSKGVSGNSIPRYGWFMFIFMILGSLGGWYSFTDHKVSIQYNLTEDIKLNQVGFYPRGTKTGIIRNAPGGIFHLKSVKTGKTVFTDSLSESARWPFSNEVIRRADFSEWNKTGEYILDIPLVGTSHPFVIEKNVHEAAHRSILKSFYYQRSSTPLSSPWAESWPRRGGHPDRKVSVHRSAVSKTRPEGTLISSPRGWYDAGDYGKYVPTATFSTAMLLNLFEHYPGYYQNFRLNIPETTDQIPDVLNEALWSIRWMLTMQEPSEGFVYHKLTTSKHARKLMPDKDVRTRFVIGKGTAATLGFAAVMAQSSRIFREFENIYPGLADSCLNASRSAWAWGRKNPNISFENPPDIHTGPCKDTRFTDELAWAAAELFVTTGEDSFYQAVDFAKTRYKHAPSRRDVGPLAWMTLAWHHRNHNNLSGLAFFSGKLKRLANRYRDHALKESAYRVPLGEGNDFLWGSNGIHANRGMLLIYMAHLEEDPSYATAALASLDYILGRNATGYCFVTGYGSKSPQQIHHRISFADGIDPPVPGLMAGGPQNEINRDHCPYADSLPATTYLDDFCSYTTNEVAINWNAALAYLSGATEVWFKNR